MKQKKIILLKSLICRNGGAEKYALRLAHAFLYWRQLKVGEFANARGGRFASEPAQLTIEKLEAGRVRCKGAPLAKAKLQLSSGTSIYRGCEVTLLTSGPTVPLHPDIKCISYEKTSWMSFQALERFDAFCNQYIQEHPTDIVLGLDRNRFQTHIRASNGVHAAYLRHREKKEGWLRGISYALNPLHRTLLAIEKQSFEHPDLRLLFTNSHMVKQEILELYRVDPQKIEVVHNGVEWEELSKDFTGWHHERLEICERLGIPSSPYHFLFVGHNYRRKGLEELLKALALLSSKDFHLSVVGKEKNQTTFVQLAKKLHLENRVTFFGSRSDLTSFYKYADSLVIPSFYDPFANVTVEALAMGLHVVSSKTNGGHEVLTPETGTVIEDLSEPDSFCAALQRAMQIPKTKESALKIRNSVKELDFSHQLDKLITRVLG